MSLGLNEMNPRIYIYLFLIPFHFCIAENLLQHPIFQLFVACCRGEHITTFLTTFFLLVIQFDPNNQIMNNPDHEVIRSLTKVFQDEIMTGYQASYNFIQMNVDRKYGILQTQQPFP
jgi:hypothetical protein